MAQLCFFGPYPLTCDMSLLKRKYSIFQLLCPYPSAHILWYKPVYLWRNVVRVVQSVQRLATGWTVRGSNPGGGEFFHSCPDRPWGPPSLLHNRYRVFPGGKQRPGRDANTSPLSNAVVMEEQSYTSTPPVGRTACTEPQCLYKGALYLTSVPVQVCTFGEIEGNTS